MTIKYTVLRLYFFAAIAGMLFSGCNGNDLESKADELIEVVKPADRIIVVKLGTDAVTAIGTQKGIVVIDAGLSYSLTSKYRKLIERELKSNDIAYLINTHVHPDHFGGNQVFKDARMIAHADVTGGITDYWKNREATRSNYIKIADDYDRKVKILKPGSEEWKETSAQLIRYKFAANDLSHPRMIDNPSQTFGDSLTLYSGDATIQLLYFGRAHSNSDIIIFIPELKLLMTGDLFSKGGRPAIENIHGADVNKWKSVMQWVMLRQENIDIVIGGHSEIMSLTDLKRFSEWIEEK